MGKFRIIATLCMSLLPLWGCSVAPVTAPPPPVAMIPIHDSDVMTRQFTTSLADLTPVAYSTRPSAVIFFNKGVNAEKFNKALCKGFVQLETAQDVESNQGVAIENQVVTKVPVTTDLSQNTRDCDLILRVYDYNLAESELVKLNPKLLYSTGPFIAVYNPNSSQIDQIIDLRCTSTADLEKFGRNWSAIFTQAAQQYEQANSNIANSDEAKEFNIWLFVRDLFQASICATDPNLIYIFNEPAGKIADIVCKGTKA